MENSFSKLKEIKDALNAKFYEREAEVEAILIALLSRQHVLMVGPSGTAKSALAIEFAKIIQGSHYFQWLLTRFSTPEELFGPLSLKDLEQGVYKRNTEAKMPEANIVFLDEIFKANSAILNSLLTIINERFFYNDGSPVNVPLISVIGASNEYPEEGEGLEALFDRFLLRFEVEYIVDDSNFISMMKNAGQNVQIPTITMENLKHFQTLSDTVIIPDEVFKAISKIRKELRDEGIRPSDRRFKQSLSILKARALIRNRNVVRVEDIVILENVVWETIDQKDTVSFIVRRHAQDNVIQKLDSIQSEVSDVYNAIKHDNSVEAGMEATQKMKALERDLNRLKMSQQGRDVEIDAMLVKVKSIQQEILNSVLEPMFFDALHVKNEIEESSGIFYRM
ncbi:AAA family ATPase [Sporosarcina thermotolerans]|uniref:AAA family ATPase n=1 Tax=Sporosarcina thermotolerans TaxID=633404 RepID=A0AAW9A3J1_9BACL|nr:AAA family ATPase [Sporosarcina thermotolerans]MDW0115636.1 AAA family ATPase [Sporosarcina thermotolerans]WHT47076.1 AAA family ATPase [Sporosarcina thermotolerans]